MRPSPSLVPSLPGRRAEHRRPLVKICGVTTVADAVAAVELGADLLGLNFHPPSPRRIDRRRAAEIAAAVAGRVPLVGVFVHHGATEIGDLVAAVGLDLVQLHGDAGPELAAAFPGRALPVFRRPSPPAVAELLAYGDVWGFLFDAPHERLYGGTGDGWDYAAVASLAAAVGPARPVLVAGGIRPGTARAALAAAGAAGVDVCSGVEAAPGIKDHRRMERLILEVHDGEDRQPA